MADDLGEFVFILADVGLEIDLDAARLENRDRGGRESIGDEDAWSHGGSPKCWRKPFTAGGKTTPCTVYHT